MIHSLRFIERDGKKVFQQQVDVYDTIVLANGMSMGSYKIGTSWEDVPLEIE